MSLFLDVSGEIDLFLTESRKIYLSSNENTKNNFFGIYIKERTK